MGVTSTACKANTIALQGITGSFRPGVLTALIGASGAGKTTLMDVLADRKTGQLQQSVCPLDVLVCPALSGTHIAMLLPYSFCCVHITKLTRADAKAFARAGMLLHREAGQH